MDQNIDYAEEYDNSARVENSDELIEQYIADAAIYRAQQYEIAELDLSYGPSERNVLDMFWPDSKAGQEKTCPIVMFIHGGYWQRMDKSTFSHLAAGLNSKGIAVAMPSYTLCPRIKIDGIIQEMQRACLVLHKTYEQKITVVGHSAGGHLAACMLATDWEALHPDLPDDVVTAGMGLSGLYDLMPLLLTPVNDAVQMDEQQALAASPIRWMPEAMQRFEAWVGKEESSEFHRQSRELSQRWSMLGTPTNYVSVPGANHFTIVDDLVSTKSEMVDKILELVKNPRIEMEIPDPDEADVEAILIRFDEEDDSTDDETEASAEAVAEITDDVGEPEDRPIEEEKFEADDDQLETEFAGIDEPEAADVNIDDDDDDEIEISLVVEELGEQAPADIEHEVSTGPEFLTESPDDDEPLEEASETQAAVHDPADTIDYGSDEVEVEEDLAQVHDIAPDAIPSDDQRESDQLEAVDESSDEKETVEGDSPKNKKKKSKKGNKDDTAAKKETE